MLHVKGDWPTRLRSRYVRRISEWQFFTNHARVLLCLARESQFRLRDVAACADLTERATHRIIGDLVEAGYLTRHKLGARNYYEVHLDRPMRHPHEEGHEIGEVLAPLLRRRSA